MKNPRTHLTVIEGGKAELERKKRILLSRPWVFSSEEFDKICEHFKLSRAEVFDLALMVTSHQAKTSYEAAALLAVMTGNANASDILARGRRGAFRVVSSEPASLPQSS